MQILDDVEEKKFQSITKKMEKIIRACDDEVLTYLINRIVKEMDYREMVRSLKK